MTKPKTGEATIRPKRQITLPSEICEILDLQVGDRLELTIEPGGRLVATPKKTLALRALDEIRQAFADSSVTEEELQEEGRRARERISRARYGRE